VYKILGKIRKREWIYYELLANIIERKNRLLYFYKIL